MNAKVFKKALVCLTLAIPFATSSSYCMDDEVMNENYINNDKNNINNDENNKNYMKNSKYDYDEEDDELVKLAQEQSNLLQNINQMKAGDQHKKFNNSLVMSQNSMMINNSQVMENWNNIELSLLNEQLNKKSDSGEENDLIDSKKAETKKPLQYGFMIKAQNKKPEFKLQNVNNFNILSQPKNGWSDENLKIEQLKYDNVEESNNISGLETSKNNQEEYNAYQGNNNNVLNYSIKGNDASWYELGKMKEFLGMDYAKALLLNLDTNTKAVDSITYWPNGEQATIIKEQMVKLTNNAQDVDTFIKLSSEFIILSKQVNQFILRFYHAKQSAGKVLFGNDKLLPKNKSGHKNIQYLIDFATKISVQKSNKPDQAKRYASEFNWLVTKMESSYNNKTDYLIGSCVQEFNLICDMLNAFSNQEQQMVGDKLHSAIEQLNNASGKLKKLLVLYQILLFAADIK